jgi:hypothetical protein
MRGQTVGGQRSLHLHFRMHVLRGLRERDEPGLPKLQWRISPPPARPITRPMSPLAKNFETASPGQTTVGVSGFGGSTGGFGNGGGFVEG